MRGLFPLLCFHFGLVYLSCFARKTFVEYVRRILLAQALTVQHHPAVVVDERNAIDAPTVILTEYHVNALLF